MSGGTLRITEHIRRKTINDKMKKIMLLGSGELGKEFVIAAKRAGQWVIACDRYDNAPAMQVADEREVFNMLDGEVRTAFSISKNPAFR